MGTSGILRPGAPPFAVAQMLSYAIADLMSAIERDDLCVVCYENEVESMAHESDEERGRWVRRYLSGGGSRHGFLWVSTRP